MDSSASPVKVIILHTAGEQTTGCDRRISRHHRVKCGRHELYFYSCAEHFHPVKTNRRLLYKPLIAAIGCKGEISLSNGHYYTCDADEDTMIVNMCVLYSITYCNLISGERTLEITLDYKDSNASKSVTSFVPIPSDEQVSDYEIPGITAIHDRRFGAFSNQPLMRLVNFPPPLPTLVEAQESTAASAQPTTQRSVFGQVIDDLRERNIRLQEQCNVLAAELEVTKQQLRVTNAEYAKLQEKNVDLTDTHDMLEMQYQDEIAALKNRNETLMEYGNKLTITAQADAVALATLRKQLQSLVV